MYEGRSYSAERHLYLYQIRLRKAKKKRRITAAVIASFLLGAIFFSSPNTPPIQVHASDEQIPADAATQDPNSAVNSISYYMDEPASQDSDSKTAVLPDTSSDQTETTRPVIFIDPGHGGTDEGCAFSGIQEKTVNLAIAQLLQKRLCELGYTVILSRSDDSYIAKEDRVILANDANADLYVSIHQNSSEDSSVNGMEVWYDGTDTSRNNRRLAALINRQTLLCTGAKKRQLHSDADFHVTGSTKMPACLIETGFLSNAAERRKLTTSEYQAQIAEGIAAGISSFLNPKTMYLTFDDGPTAENTVRVLDILKNRNIKATFFLIGENVQKHPEVARRIAAEGHTIGIHCNVHDYKMLYKSVDSYIQDFETAHRIVYETTGIDTKLFRFPGGSINAYNENIKDAIIQEMSARGYLYFDWNASLEDALGDSTPEQLITNGVETTLGRKKVILLAHDVVYSTGVCLDELLDELAEYEMLPLDEEVEPIRF